MMHVKLNKEREKITFAVAAKLFKIIIMISLGLGLHC